MRENPQFQLPIIRHDQLTPLFRDKCLSDPINVLIPRRLILQIGLPRTQPPRLRIDIHRTMNATIVIRRALQRADIRGQKGLDCLEFDPVVERYAQVDAELFFALFLKMFVGEAELPLGRIIPCHLLNHGGVGLGQPRGRERDGGDAEAFDGHVAEFEWGGSAFFYIAGHVFDSEEPLCWEVPRIGGHVDFFSWDFSPFVAGGE